MILMCPKEFHCFRDNLEGRTKTSGMQPLNPKMSNPYNSRQPEHVPEPLEWKGLITVVLVLGVFVTNNSDSMVGWQVPRNRTRIVAQKPGSHVPSGID